MPADRPDPNDFLEMAQRMLRGLFDPSRGDDDDPWARATDRGSATRERRREPNAEERRENLTFALATRAVEALEDLALNVAAIRQRLERTTTQEARPGTGDATGGDADPA
ncbi:hypothetical protein JOD57_002063 [Geodermatophilus bullaregiensis]|uniref:hypothetical protein n=1 Tax=Geodermatophilus bullaregiensis TaxID=1564160 RepID=UPI001EF9B231|nr:hypothetical protein [Geodermatophilus bullaregiensis]MBM7806226.1 hypothetical protein [Geodermatophilus bullaregiensis]